MSHLEEEHEERVFECLHYVDLTRQELAQVVWWGSSLRDDLYRHDGVVGLRVGFLQAPRRHVNT